MYSLRQIVLNVFGTTPEFRCFRWGAWFRMFSMRRVVRIFSLGRMLPEVFVVGMVSDIFVWSTVSDVFIAVRVNLSIAACGFRCLCCGASFWMCFLGASVETEIILSFSKWKMFLKTDKSFSFWKKGFPNESFIFNQKSIKTFLNIQLEI